MESTVVDISMTPPSFKPVSVVLSRFSQSKTPKQVIFNPIKYLDSFNHTLFTLFYIIYFFSFINVNIFWILQIKIIFKI